MKRKAGQEAPDFTVTDINNHRITLSDYRGSKVLLGFFRNVNCPFCNLRVHELSKLRERLEANNLKMILFFESSTKHLQRSSFHQEVSPIPLIGDPEKKIYATYGVEASVLKMVSTLFKAGAMSDMKRGKELPLPTEKDKDATQSLIPADFLIDEKGIIVSAHYGSDIRDHISIKSIMEFAGLPY